MTSRDGPSRRAALSCRVQHLSGPWAKTKPKLSQLNFWLWSVAQVIRPGQVIPGFRKVAESFVCDAHLYQPKKGVRGTGDWAPLFTDDRVSFMRTPAEKARRKRRRLSLRGTEKKKIKKVRAVSESSSDDGICNLRPIRCFLRPENIVGGGFGRTASGAIPNAIQQHALAELAAH